MVPQLRVRPTVALPMFMPLLRVKVVLPLMTTGADGLAMVMPFQVTALPNVLVQLASVDTVEFQMALSPLPGAVPLTQLPPDCRAVLLFALVWSARAANAAMTTKKPADRNVERMSEEWLNIFITDKGREYTLRVPILLERVGTLM